MIKKLLMKFLFLINNKSINLIFSFKKNMTNIDPTSRFMLFVLSNFQKFYKYTYNFLVIILYF